jgi:aspartokinase/homoserine dehydrogenase 1
LKDQLKHIKIKGFTTEAGISFSELNLSYQVFGKELGTAPVVLINHALTGHSNVAGDEG